MKTQTKYARKRSPVQKMIVHLKNVPVNGVKKKDFVTTHAYYEVADENEARRILEAMHDGDTITKVVYASKPFAFSKTKIEEVFTETKKQKKS